MATQEINLLDELTSAADIHTLKPADIDAMMQDFAKRIARILRIERINVWVFNPDKTAMISIAEYDHRIDEFKKDSILYKKDFPNYFNLLKENKFVYIHDCFIDEKVAELKESYFVPNDIITLVDVPLRIGNEVFGVMCFEKTGRTIRNYTEQNLNFIFSIAMVMSSNLEARYRRGIQHKLDATIKEKELLIQEINHRVKNNFAILLSLLRLNKSIVDENNIKVIFEEYEQRIHSMLKIHDLLLNRENYSEVDLSEYLNELIEEYKETYPQLDFKISIQKLSGFCDTKKALNLGMIVTEIFLNTVKHAKNDNGRKLFSLELYENNGITYLKIGDNGNGFEFNDYDNLKTIGLMLVRNLCESINAELIKPTEGNSNYEIRF
ncbi:MAG: histidine kinase dimerization/phosphoacceptor domain -containing protein [Fluviicola sp.]